MKPYIIPAPRIWVTDQAPIIYGGKLFYIKPSYVLGDKSKNSTTTDMDQNIYKEQLLKKRNHLILEIANYSLIIEEQTFYNLAALELEIQNLENLPPVRTTASSFTDIRSFHRRKLLETFD